MSVKSNVVANYIGTFFIVLAPVLALPNYLHEMGANVWGLVSLITTLQALMSILDAGVSQALVREFSQNKNVTYQEQKIDALLLFGFEKIYWSFAFVVGLVVVLFSDQITNQWLKVGSVGIDQAKLALYGAVGIFFLQFPGSVYRSFLTGIQAQVLLNLIMTVGVLIKHVGGVVIVFIWPNLFAFLLWQGFSAALETFVRRFYAWRVFKLSRPSCYWDHALMKRISLPIIGMSGATLFATLTVQMDKIILSGMVSIEKFGYYVIASTLSIGALQLIYPIVNAAIPYAVDLKKKRSLTGFNIAYAKIVLAIIIIFWLLFYFFGDFCLNLWLRDFYISTQIYGLLKFLLVGTALNALYTIGYINWIVEGRFDRVFQVNLISFILSIILMPILIVRYGMFGASLGWILINAVGLFFSLEWLLNIFSKSKPSINL